MILIILLITSYAYDNQGTLQINQSLQLNTNFTEQAPSIMIKFILPNYRLLQNDVTIGCFVSYFDMVQMDIESLQLSKNKTIVYDLHSIQSNSEIQVVTYNYYDVLYLYCQSNMIGEVKYELTYKEEYFNIDCINQCQGYNDSKSVSQSYCSGDHCECQINQLGSFCQLQTKFLLSSTEEDIVLKAKSWIFFYYQFSTIDIELKCDQNNEIVWYSLALRQIPQIVIPNHFTANTLKQNQSLYDKLQQMTLFDVSNILYIGLYNSGDQEINFKLELVANGSDGSSNLERNKIIIISVGSVIGVLLLITFVLSIWKTKRIQEQQMMMRQRQMALRQANELRQQNQQRQQQIIAKQSSGFSIKFIKDYFGVVSYKKLVQIYPGLLQFDDCVICLESIKSGQSRAQRHCSVTPCFHIFHQKCLISWLEKQKNCPFCRAEFTRTQIQEKYPWLDLKQQRSNQGSQYISNLKYSQATEQTQDNKLNDSQQELVGKNIQAEV